MSYLVMESRPGYAIVMDSQGRFLKVVNLNYQAGQHIDRVISFEEQDQMRKKAAFRKQFTAVAAAACFCIILLGAYVQCLLPQGTVRMKINPDVMLTVNRLDHVVDLDGLNEDGKALIEEYQYFWKRVEVVTDELADRAVEQGYLAEGGEIQLFVESKSSEWKTATEDLLITELTIHLEDKVHVVTSTEAEEDDVIIIEPGNNATKTPENIPAGNQALEDTDYGPTNDGVTDYDGTSDNDSDYGPSNDGVTDYNDAGDDYDDAGDDYDDAGDDYDDAGDDYDDVSDDYDDGASNYGNDDGASNYGNDDGASNYSNDDGMSNYSSAEEEDD